MVARSVEGIFFTSVKYTNSLFFARAPEMVINASRVNYVNAIIYSTVLCSTV